MENSSHGNAWRTKEIEEYSNLYLIHPLSARIARYLAQTGWSPNQVSMLGLASALAAAYCFYHYQVPALAFLGLLFMLGWHVFDGADGQLARLTNQASDSGRVIDGLCDHIGFGSVYVALALALQSDYGPWVWLVALGAGISHIIQAGCLEYHRDTYDCLVHGRYGKCVPTLSDLQKSIDSATGLPKLGYRLHGLYVSVQYLCAESDEALLAFESANRKTAARDKLSQSYGDAMRKAVGWWHVLSANKRTFAVGLCCVFQYPIVFFFYELIVLNLTLFWLRHRQRKLNNRIRRELDHFAAN